MTNSYRYIEHQNLSLAWASVFKHMMSKGVNTVSPMVVSIQLNGDTSPENHAIREALNSALIASKKFTVDTVANTIFPNSFWNSSLGREELFKRYSRIQPRLLKVRQNHNGTYFQRLIAYDHGDGKTVNQLEHVINIYRGGNHRNSALQASIFDPARDHSNLPFSGFPCMQHVQFSANGSELSIIGVYATQYVFEKAYGNYLGLYRLGRFMAHEMGLSLKRVTCFSTKVALGGNVTKTELRALEMTIDSYL